MSFFNKVSNDTDNKSRKASAGQDSVDSASEIDSDISDLDKLLDKVLAEKKNHSENESSASEPVSEPAPAVTEKAPEPEPVTHEIHSVKPSDLLNGLVPETTDHKAAVNATDTVDSSPAMEQKPADTDVAEPSEESSHSFFSLDDTDSSSSDNAFSLEDDQHNDTDLSSILGDDHTTDGSAADILTGDTSDTSAADVFSSDTDDSQPRSNPLFGGSTDTSDSTSADDSQSVDDVYDRLFGSGSTADSASSAQHADDTLATDNTSQYDDETAATDSTPQYDYDTGTQADMDFDIPTDTTTDTSNDALLVQIDAFRDKAVRLSGLINANQKKVESLETQVKEKEGQIAALQDELSTKQREADTLVTTVESQVDRMLVSVKDEFSSFNNDVTGRISKSTRADAEKLARMMEKVNNGVVEIKDFLAHPQDETTLEDVKNELSEKIHSENVKAFRNIQDTLKENDHSEELDTSLEEKYRSLKGKSAVLLVVLILNFGVTIVMFLMNIGILPTTLLSTLGI